MNLSALAPPTSPDPAKMKVEVLAMQLIQFLHLKPSVAIQLVTDNLKALKSEDDFEQLFREALDAMP